MCVCDVCGSVMCVCAGSSAEESLMNRWLDRWLTLLLLALIGWAGWSCLHWLWNGADWTVVMTNLPLYAVGSYPEDERWRPLLCIVAVVVLIVITLVGPPQHRKI